MKTLQLENESGHIVTIECSPRTKDPELRTQLFSQSLTAEFSGPFHQMQREEDFFPTCIVNRNNTISHRHRVEDLVEESPQMEN
ncbi:unnamed protein product [Ceratitis capitata]|uniref:(Mediterranean fruit fly) hypothetical protein n=1 Tax=Ceratitis capitata TaxID=7213 RepID=A0A811US21_CERCA|nr:unnamed protein product [Ceratitis capitata]